MLYQKVKIVRDIHTVYNRAIPAWEIPVLEIIFDQGNVQPTGVLEMVDREYPEPGVEFDRLMRRYGSDQKSGTAFVAIVYGSAGAGINALKFAIEEAKAEEDAMKAAGTAPKVHYAPVSRQVAESDSLMA